MKSRNLLILCLLVSLGFGFGGLLFVAPAFPLLISIPSLYIFAGGCLLGLLSVFIAIVAVKIISMISSIISRLIIFKKLKKFFGDKIFGVVPTKETASPRDIVPSTPLEEPQPKKDEDKVETSPKPEFGGVSQEDDASDHEEEEEQDADLSLRDDASQSKIQDLVEQSVSQRAQKILKDAIIQQSSPEFREDETFLNFIDSLFPQNPSLSTDKENDYVLSFAIHIQRELVKQSTYSQSECNLKVALKYYREIAFALPKAIIDSVLIYDNLLPAEKLEHGYIFSMQVFIFFNLSMYTFMNESNKLSLSEYKEFIDLYLQGLKNIRAISAQLKYICEKSSLQPSRDYESEFIKYEDKILTEIHGVQSAVVNSIYWDDKDLPRGSGEDDAPLKKEMNLYKASSELNGYVHDFRRKGFKRLLSDGEPVADVFEIYAQYQERLKQVKANELKKVEENVYQNQTYSERRDILLGYSKMFLDEIELDLSIVRDILLDYSGMVLGEIDRDPSIFDACLQEKNHTDASKP